VGLTTGLIRSSSEGFVETFELGTVADCAGTEREPPTTVGGGREATGGGGGASETVGLGTSQVPSGTRAAAAAPPMTVFRKVVPEEGKVAKGREAEGTAGFGGVGAAVLRIAAISTFPTGV
jgi:hypothetical protein